MSDHRTRSEVAWAALGSLAFALLFFHQILGHISVPIRPDGGISDWDFSLEFSWAASHTIAHFHQFPLWDPYKCGGMPLFANPQSAILTPFLILDLVFGPLIAMRLAGIAHVAIAFGGAYFLARALGISPLGAIACGAVFAGSSWPYLHFELGQANFLPLAYAPWAIVALWIGSERHRLVYAAAGGLAMALMLMEGAQYQFIFTATMLAVLAPAIALERRSRFPLLFLIVMGAFAAGFGAIKLLPGISFSGWHSTIREWNESYSLREMLAYLFWRVPEAVTSPRVLIRMDSGLASVHRPYFELDAYVGVLFGVMALLGALMEFRRAFPWIVLALILLALAAGNIAPYSPWVLMHKVPFLASMRIPARWLMPFTLAAGVLAGFGIDAIRTRAKPLSTIVGILVGLAVFDSWLVSTHDLHRAVEGGNPVMPVQPVFRHLYDKNAGGLRMFPAAKANLGLVACYDVPGLLPKTRVLGFNEPGYRGEQYLLGPGTIALSRWTPNALSFDVDAPAPTVMVVNQNYDPGWRLAQGGGAVVSSDGLIGVKIPAGKRRIALVYRGNRFVAGLWITLIAFAAMLALWRYKRIGCQRQKSD